MNSQQGRTQKDLEQDIRMFEEMVRYESRQNVEKFRILLTEISDKNEYKVYEAIGKLCAELSLAEENQLEGFPLEEYIEQLLHCLSIETIPDIMLLSATCIGHLLDLFPDALPMLVHHGALPLLVYKIQNIQYIDLAEHSIKILHRLSLQVNENGPPILKLDAFAILTNFIDFFVSNVQKQIIEILINLIRPISDINILNNHVLPNLPALRNYMINNNERNSKFCIIYSNILEKVVKLNENDEDQKQAYIQNIIDIEILQKTILMFEEILVDGLPQEQLNVVENMVKMFKKSCYYNLDFFLFCLEQGLIQLFDRCLQILQDNYLVDDANSTLYLLIEIFFFFNSVLALKVKNNNLIIITAPHYGLKIVENVQVQERKNIFINNRQYYKNIIKTVFTRIPIFYEKVNHTFLKYILLIIIEKIFCFSEKEEIEELLALQMESNSFLIFYSQLLQENDMMIIVLVLLIVQSLMEKNISQIYHIIQREGIDDFLNNIINKNSLSQIQVNQNSNKKKTKKTVPKSGEKTSKLEEFIKKNEGNPQNLKNLIIKKQELDELEVVRKETRKLASELLDNYSQEKQDDYEEVNSTLSILSKHLREQSDNTLQSPHQIDYGRSVYQSLKHLYSKFGTITSYEFERHGIYQQLFNYLTTQQSSSISITAHRIHAFISEMYMDNTIYELVRSLQKSNNQARTQWTKSHPQDKPAQNNLKQNLRFLTQRAKFKVKFIESQEVVEERERMELQKSQSQMNSSIKMQTIKEVEQTFLNQQQQLYDYKLKFFTEIPVFIMSLEQFGTLDSIEEYLLNKLESKSDLDYQGIFKHYLKTLKQEQRKNEIEKLKQVQQLEDQIKKKDNKREEETKQPLDENEWDKKIQRKMSQQQSENNKDIIESLKNQKLQIGDYLEIGFSINGQKVTKQSTVYELGQKYQKEQEQLLIEFSLIKKEQKDRIYMKGIKKKEEKKEEEKEEEEEEGKRVVMEVIQTKASSEPALSLMRVLDKINRELAWFTGKSSSLSVLWKGEGVIDINMLMKSDKVSKEMINEKMSQEGKNRWTNTLLMTGKSQAEWIMTTSNSNQSQDIFYSNGDKFLYDLDSRIAYFQHVTQSTYRALYYIYQHNKDKVKEMESTKIGKLKRKKIKFMREGLLESALKSLRIDHETSHKEKETVLEFEFLNEEGSGIGPTLEFYTLLGQQLLSDDLDLFSQSKDGTWFPKPYQQKNTHSRSNPTPTYDKTTLFSLIGQIVARAILDERVFDLPLSPLWWKLVIKQSASVHDLQDIQPELYSFLIELQGILNRKAQGEDNHTLLYQGASLDTLSIYFCLPGYEHIPLVDNGLNLLLTIDNLHLYLSSILLTFFHSTLNPLLTAFTQGFSSLIQINKLQCFHPYEIATLYVGDGDQSLWTYEEIKNNIIAAHGYHDNSAQIINFVKIISSFNVEEQKSFLRFTTGCPRLPMGGFKKMHPRLTIVKKQVDNNNSCDLTLPSVMTYLSSLIHQLIKRCQNYLKLPFYTSEEIMRKQLLYVMKEGQNSFSLS